MSATMTEVVVAKKTAPEPEESIPKTTTKVRMSTIQKAKALAAINDQDLFEYLDELLTPLIEKEYVRRVKE